MEPLTLKSLASFIDDQINYTLEADTESESAEDKAYYKGRLKALNIILAEIDKGIRQQEAYASNLEPTSAELDMYSFNKIRAIAMYRERTHQPLRESAQAFGFQAS